MNVDDTGTERGPRIFKLNLETQQWQDTGVQIDARNNVRSDVLWDGSKLYVATHVFSESPATGSPSNLYRFSYNTSNDTYTLDSGFPAADQQLAHRDPGPGQGLDRPAVGHVDPAVPGLRQPLDAGDNTWGTPFALSGGNGLTADDISSVVAFGGNRIGIMWSDQSDVQMKFAFHQDSRRTTPPGAVPRWRCPAAASPTTTSTSRPTRPVASTQPRRPAPVAAATP